MTYPDSEVVTFNYNNNMLPISVSGTSTYAQTIAYDSAMRMTQLVRGANKINTVFNYNAWNQDGGRLLNTTSTQVSTGTQLQNSIYDYDSVGNILTITDSLLGPQTQTFQYDALDRLTSSNVTGGSNGLYSETYTYNASTGNLASKGTVNYTAYDANHKHAVTNLSNGNSYAYDANGNMTSRNVGGQSFTLAYDAENRLVSVSGAATASFVYDADGKQVKSIVGSVTTYYVGSHYEVKNSVVTKYYFAGATRIAVRTNGTLSYLLGDHLGSSSVTTDANGVQTATALYKAFGETRYTLGNLGTDYKFTGQRLQAELGIYWFQSRWMDPSLGRFTSPDTIVPTSTQGTQGWDRYAFVNNNPVRYNDPTGHNACDPDDEDCIESDNSELDDLVEEEFNPVEAYCGDTSTLGCLAMLAQDVATLIDLVGVGLIEVPAVGAGCIEGGPLGCAIAEVGVIVTWNTTLNTAETAASSASLILTIADDLLNNGGWGENSSTSLATFVAGLASLTPSWDLVVDGYSSGYNHGFFNGISTILSNGLFK